MHESISKVEYKLVEEYNNNLHQIALEINQIFETIKMVATVVDDESNFSGEAKEYYIKKLKDLMFNFEEIYNEIENCVIYIAACSDGYQALDRKVAKEILENLNLPELSLEQSTIFKTN
jgi:uncharacterized protein YukE